jgi:hypothetical protein
MTARETQCDSLAMCFISTLISKTSPLGFASSRPRGAGALF